MKNLKTIEMNNPNASVKFSNISVRPYWFDLQSYVRRKEGGHPL